MDLVNLHGKVVSDSLNLRKRRTVSHHRKGRGRKGTYNQILPHRLELIANVVVVAVLLPFLLQQVESLLENGEWSDSSFVGTLREEKVQYSLRRELRETTHRGKTEIGLLELLTRSDDGLLVPVNDVLQQKSRLARGEEATREGNALGLGLTAPGTV